MMPFPFIPDSGDDAPSHPSEVDLTGNSNLVIDNY